MSSSKSLSLRSVNSSDLQFLYDLLKQRQSNENISHKKLPTFTQHTVFVKSKPYSKWYMILEDKSRLGSIYLSKQNEVGIFIDKNFRKLGIGNKSLELLIQKNPRKRYLANINPQNIKSIKFFTKNKFKLIQYTYELNPSE
jgi:RimJ/RimL family protein N-acetyltransferase